MEQAKIYVVQVTENGTARVVGGALTEDNAVILADKFADAVVNTGAIPKVTPTGYDTPTGTEPREIRRYEFRRGGGGVPPGCYFRVGNVGGNEPGILRIWNARK